MEVSSVLKNGNREYQNIEYKIDTEISVQKNNFVIFLKDEDVEKFEMKFNFGCNKTIDKIKEPNNFIIFYL